MGFGPCSGPGHWSLHSGYAGAGSSVKKRRCHHSICVKVFFTMVAISRINAKAIETGVNVEELLLAAIAKSQLILKQNTHKSHVKRVSVGFCFLTVVSNKTDIFLSK